MAITTEDFYAEREQPLNKLEALIKDFKKKLGEKVVSVEELRGYVSAISNSVRTTKNYYEDKFIRGDQLPQALEMVARAFELPNRPETFKQEHVEKIRKIVVYAKDHPIINSKYLNTEKEELNMLGIKTDYLSRNTNS